MSTWRDRMTTAPLWALFVYFAVVFGGLLYLMQGAGSKRWLAGAIGGSASGASRSVVVSHPAHLVAAPVRAGQYRSGGTLIDAQHASQAQHLVRIRTAGLRCSERKAKPDRGVSLHSKTTSSQNEP